MSSNFYNINQGLRIKPTGSAPSNPQEGDTYYHSSYGMRVYSGGGWRAVGNAEFTTKTSNYTASGGDRLLADTSGGAFTITLPAAPLAGAEVRIVDAGGTFAANNLTVARNGETIAATAEDFVLDVDNLDVSFVYVGSPTGWHVTLGGAELAPASIPGTAGSVYSNGSTLQSVAFSGNGNKLVGVNAGGTSAEAKSIATGTGGSDFAVSHGTGTITFNLPDAGASARGAVTTGAQTIAGAKTFSSDVTCQANIVLNNAVPSFSAADIGYVGSKYAGYLLRDGSGTGVNYGLNSAYWDGTKFYRAVANQLSSRTVWFTTTTSASSYFQLDFDTSTSHSADTEASWSTVFKAVGNGNVTLGTSSSNAHTVNGSLTFATGGANIFCNTSDSSDNDGVHIYAGSAASSTRGAQCHVFGNEHATDPGRFVAYCGNAVTGASTAFFLGNSGGTQILSGAANGVLNVTTASWGTGGTAVGVSGGALTTSPSSARYKTNIAPLNTASGIDTSKIYDLNPVVFDYINDGRHSFGYIAEEVFDILPCLVHQEPDQEGVLRPESVSYEHVAVLLVAELKKLRDEFEAYKASHP